MTIFYDAPVTPDALTAFVRNVPIPGTLSLSTLFPTTQAQSNTIDWSEITSTNRTARFRSYDGRIHVSDRDGYSDKQVRMIPLSDSLNAGEYERLQLEFARTGGTRREALANAVYNDAQVLTGHVQNRMEQAVGDILVDGKLTINENGLITEADYGVPANQLITVGTAWTTTATAPALDNLIAALDVYVAANGTAPGSILTSRRVLRLMQTNAQLVGAAVGTASGKTRINLDELGSLFDAEGVPSGITVYDTVLDVDGVTTRVIPDDRLIFLPPNVGDLLEIRYGVSATGLELVNSNKADLSFEDAPGIVGVVEKVGPPYREFTFVDAVGMPFLKDARKLMVLDVA
jgi:hypothetical protein